MIISIIFALVFAVLDTLGVNNIGQTQAIVNYIHVLFVTPAYVLFKRKQLSLSFSAHYFLFFCFITSVSALLVADNDSFRAIWFFLSTIIAYVFCGRKMGHFYAFLSFSCIFIDGFFLPSNLNTVSVLSSLMSYSVLVLIMAAYTSQMESHLDHIDHIQNELYYLANKSEISSALQLDRNHQRAEQLMNFAKEQGDEFSLMHIEISNKDDLLGTIEPEQYQQFFQEVVERVEKLVSQSDIVSALNSRVIYLALPFYNQTSVINLLNKIKQHINDDPISIDNISSTIRFKASSTKLNSQDLSIRSMHIRADRGMDKAKLSPHEDYIYVKS